MLIAVGVATEIVLILLIDNTGGGPRRLWDRGNRREGLAARATVRRRHADPRRGSQGRRPVAAAAGASARGLMMTGVSTLGFVH